MPNGKSVSEFLNNLTPTEEVFKEEDSASTEIVESKIEKEEKLPFHKDPKVQKFIEKEISKRLADVKPSVEQTFRKEVTDEINLPPALVKFVGNDTEEKRQVLNDLAVYLDSLTDKAQEKFLEKLEEQKQEQVQEDNAAVEELENGFEEIEDQFGVDLTSNSPSAQKLDADFRSYIRKIAPKDENGEVKAFPDLVSAFEEFQEKNTRTKPASRAKELATRGMTRSTDTSNAAPVLKSGKGDPWRQVDQYFDKLKRNN